MKRTSRNTTGNAGSFRSEHLSDPAQVHPNNNSGASPPGAPLESPAVTPRLVGLSPVWVMLTLGDVGNSCHVEAATHWRRSAVALDVSQVSLSLWSGDGGSTGNRQRVAQTVLSTYKLQLTSKASNLLRSKVLKRNNGYVMVDHSI